jgi:hypothetical protein
VADALARLRAFVRVTPIGESSARAVASLASLSALSFPGMPEWLGHQERVMLTLGSDVRRWFMSWQKECEYCWPAVGLDWWMVVRAGAQSVKMWISRISGWVGAYEEARLAASMRPASSASEISACPPRPIWRWKTSFWLQ